MKLICIFALLITLSLLATPVMSGSALKRTSWTKASGGDIVYLDRQRPSCPAGSAMSYFYLDRSGSNRDNVRYEFTCLSSGNVQSTGITNKTTSYNSTSGKKSVNYLDRHNVNCPTGTLLKSFKLQRSGSKIRYAYSCTPAKTLCCKNVSTGKTDMGNKSFFYLDRQRSVGVEGSNKWAMKGFRLQSNYSPDKIYYKYELCQVTDEAAELALKQTKERYDAALTNMQALELELLAKKQAVDELESKCTKHTSDLLAARANPSLKNDC
jgi:hypothetical protein